MRISDWSSDVCSSDLETEATRIQTLPRIGYRLTGPVERGVSGRRLNSRLDLAADQMVPGREHFILDRQLGPAHAGEVWLARHDKTGEPRVYKFSADGEHLAALKRERSEEHTSELQSLMRIPYAVFCLKKQHRNYRQHTKM